MAEKRNNLIMLENIVIDIQIHTMLFVLYYLTDVLCYILATLYDIPRPFSIYMFAPHCLY